MKIAYYCTNRTVFPSPPDIVAANAQVMFDIVTGIIKKGHDITIYASKGSHVEGAKIVDLGLPPHQLDHAYVHEEWVKDLHIAYRIAYISDLVSRSHEYDLIHLHVGRAIFGEPFLRYAKCPIVFTIHETLEPHFAKLMNLYPKANLVSVSNAQRRPIPSLNYVDTIYHGVDVSQFQFNPKPTSGLLFLSRISKEKGVEFAIKTAQKTGEGLDIYGPGDEKYLKSAVKPYLNDKIKYHGMVKLHSPEWYQAYANTKVFLFPIQWNESFGLVMIEAMACGTPVIAFRQGAVPEVIKDGETGIIVEPGDLSGMVEAVKKIYEMPDSDYQKMRKACRKHVEDNFTIDRMVDNYEKLYEKIISQ